ncbi:MAG: hypothetical protein NTX50_23190, partial [Candidatus Sumerlaeota bacterium]|nr:hypothetical protein [Candidatus Sumerlaeota bacterium]
MGKANDPVSTSSHSLVISLNGDWRLWYGPQDKNAPQTPDDLKAPGKEQRGWEQHGWEEIPAIVPGCYELDLLRAGRIKDPSIGNQV